jgi:hypothetical protein
MMVAASQLSLQDNIVLFLAEKKNAAAIRLKITPTRISRIFVVSFAYTSFIMALKELSVMAKTEIIKAE